MVHTEGKNDRVEIWKDIKDYENLYQSSTFGRARSLDTYRKGKNGSVRLCKGKILEPVTTKDGYLQVVLCKNGKKKTYYVHRLVAEAFIETPEELKHLNGTRYLQVNHKDENKQNNNAENLEWCDRTYNINYGTRNERCSKPVLQYTLDGQFIREWESATEAGRNGFNQGNVAACCQGKRKSHHKFIWKYK